MDLDLEFIKVEGTDSNLYEYEDITPIELEDSNDNVSPNLNLNPNHRLGGQQQLEAMRAPGIESTVILVVQKSSQQTNDVRSGQPGVHSAKCYPSYPSHRKRDCTTSRPILDSSKKKCPIMESSQQKCPILDSSTRTCPICLETFKDYTHSLRLKFWAHMKSHGADMIHKLPEARAHTEDINRWKFSMGWTNIPHNSNSAPVQPANTTANTSQSQSNSRISSTSCDKIADNTEEATIAISCPLCSKEFANLAARGRHIRLSHRSHPAESLISTSSPESDSLQAQPLEGINANTQQDGAKDTSNARTESHPKPLNGSSNLEKIEPLKDDPLSSPTVSAFNVSTAPTDDVRSLKLKCLYCSHVFRGRQRVANRRIHTKVKHRQEDPTTMATPHSGLSTVLEEPMPTVNASPIKPARLVNKGRELRFSCTQCTQSYEKICALIAHQQAEHGGRKQAAQRISL